MMEYLSISYKYESLSNRIYEKARAAERKEEKRNAKKIKNNNKEFMLKLHLLIVYSQEHFVILFFQMKLVKDSQKRNIY